MNTKGFDTTLEVDVAEVVAPEVVAEEKPEKPKRGRGRPAKGEKKVKSPQKADVTNREKFVAWVSEKVEIPPIESLFNAQKEHKVDASSIAILRAEHKQGLLKELAFDSENANEINVPEVDVERVKKLAIEILMDGEMYSSIEVANIDGKLQCWSGRHRLAVLMLLYGNDIKVPCNVRKMSKQEAFKAVVRANECRPTVPLEKIEHAIIKATGGAIDISRQEFYDKVMTKRSNVGNYAIQSVLRQKNYGMSINFTVAANRKKNKAITTVANLKNFFTAALYWEKNNTCEEFDTRLKTAVKFINTFMASIDQYEGFDRDQHVTGKVLTAIGKWCNQNDDFEQADALASCVVGQGEIGSQPSEKTLKAITKCMKE